MVLARGLARAVRDVAVDALATPFGGALPLSPEAFSDPARFRALVDAWATDRGAPNSPPMPTPTSVRTTLQRAPSSNCRNSGLALDWPPGARDEPLPRRLFLKQSTHDLPTRVFAQLIGFWKIECAVARHLAGSLPIDSPRIHAVGQLRSRFFILMENLLDRDRVRLFVNRDFLAGVDVALAHRCVRTLARLHAHYVHWTPAQREAALPLSLHPFLSPELQPVMLAVNRSAISRCQAGSEGIYGDAEVEITRRALAHWPALQRAWYPEPLTLLHGDCHLGNFFEAGGELGMLDFQGAHWGRGPRDVHYFLVNSMRPDVLARHEQSLFAAYVEERRRCAAPVDADVAWNEYRGFSFQTLMTAVVSLGLGSFTDSEDVMRAMLARSVAALHRLRFAEWLDAAIAAA
jgi:hypothetical protein